MAVINSRFRVQTWLILGGMLSLLSLSAVMVWRGSQTPPLLEDICTLRVTSSSIKLRISWFAIFGFSQGIIELIC